MLFLFCFFLPFFLNCRPNDCILYPLQFVVITHVQYAYNAYIKIALYNKPFKCWIFKSFSVYMQNNAITMLELLNRIKSKNVYGEGRTYTGSACSTNSEWRRRSIGMLFFKQVISFLKAYITKQTYFIRSVYSVPKLQICSSRFEKKNQTYYHPNFFFRPGATDLQLWLP